MNHTEVRPQESKNQPSQITVCDIEHALRGPAAAVTRAVLRLYRAAVLEAKMACDRAEEAMSTLGFDPSNNHDKREQLSPEAASSLRHLETVARTDDLLDSLECAATLAVLRWNPHAIVDRPFEQIFRTVQPSTYLADGDHIYAVIPREDEGTVGQIDPRMRQTQLVVIPAKDLVDLDSMDGTESSASAENEATGGTASSSH